MRINIYINYSYWRIIKYYVLCIYTCIYCSIEELITSYTIKIRIQNYMRKLSKYFQRHYLSDILINILLLVYKILIK